MNSKERRAAAHKDRKLARKAGFPAPAPAPVPVSEMPAPVSEAQLTANRANAQHSTGPKTESGRAISSQNRTTHGLARHNGVFIFLPAEDRNGFEALKVSLAAEHKPTTETESILINGMAESHWLANRAQTLQNTCLTNFPLFSLYLCYQTTHTRAFHKCLNGLVKQSPKDAKPKMASKRKNAKKKSSASRTNAMK